MARERRKGSGQPTDAASPDESAPVVDVPLTSTGAFKGDPIVLVRLTGATVLLPCYAMDAKQRQMFVNGLSCEHVGEAADGTWIYEQRAY